MNMKTLKYIALATALAGTATSCSDFLDVKPVGKMIPTQVSQFENLLNNSNTIGDFMMDNNKGCFYAMMGDNLQMSETHYNYEYTSSHVNLDLLAAHIFYTPVLNPKSTYWSWSYGIYRPVGVFNNVIDGVSELDAESEYAKGVIAQARFGRAWIYMNAVLCYGPMYDPAGANDTPVLPLRVSGDPTVSNGPLVTTADFFALVKEDLDYACTNAPLSVGNPSRANRAAAYAQRAEYYMYLRDWPNMLKDAQEAWKLALANRGSVDELIYDFDDFYYVETSPVTPPEGCSPEYYMTLKGPDLDFDQTVNRENLVFRKVPYNSAEKKYYPSDDWQAIFDPQTDQRYKLFLLKAPGFSINQGETLYDDGPQPINVRDQLALTQGMTYPLLLLMKAEAEARTGATGDALQSLNTLRKYRYEGEQTDLVGGSQLTQDELLNEILTERRREQPMVSFQRMLDLKRYAFDSGKPWSKATITHTVGSKTFSKPITDSYFQSLPIDNAILEYNPQWGIAPNTNPYEPYNAK